MDQSRHYEIHDTMLYTPTNPTHPNVIHAYIIQSGSATRAIQRGKILTILRISVTSLRLRSSSSTFLNNVGLVDGLCLLDSCERCKCPIHGVHERMTKAYLSTCCHLRSRPRRWWHPPVAGMLCPSRHYQARVVLRRWPCCLRC